MQALGVEPKQEASRVQSWQFQPVALTLTPPQGQTFKLGALHLIKGGQRAADSLFA